MTLNVIQPMNTAVGVIECKYIKRLTCVSLLVASAIFLVKFVV